VASQPSNYDNVPVSLRNLLRWIVWRNETVDGKPNKTPYQSVQPLKKAATTRSKEWSSFSEAVDCANDPANGMSGIGLVIAKPYIFIDIDHCVKENGTFNDMAYEYLEMANSYSEYSHNDGIHILGRGNSPTAAIKPTAHEHVELYTHDRYMAFTGKVLNGRNTITEWTDVEAEEIYAHAARQIKKNKEQVGNLKLNRDARFTLLMDGRMNEAGFTDASAAVHSLLIELASRKDCDQKKMEEEFLASKLYTVTAKHWQKKWDRLRVTELARAVEHAKSRQSKRAPVPDDPNAIVLEAGDIHNIPIRCEKVLTENDGTENDLHFFSRGRELVRPIIAKELGESKQFRRDSAAVIITPVSELTLIRMLSENARFVRPTEKKWVPADPTSTHAAHVIDRVKAGQADCYRVLNLVTSCPCLLPSGEVLDEPGYKEGVLYVASGVKFEKVKEFPTHEDAIEALAQFKEIFCECAFVEKIGDTYDAKTALFTASYAAVLAACLSIVARPALPTVPITAINAPTAGSAKSKTADACSLATTGTITSTINYRDDEEIGKALLPLLKSGDRTVLNDNIDRPFKSYAVNTIITAPGEALMRVLGRSELEPVVNTSVFFATGNGLRIEGDLVRRSVMVSLDTGEEKPQNTMHSFDLTVRARERFPQLVVAALTALRAYHCAGRPDMLGKTAALGSFEEWHRFIVGTLLWCGYKDPVTTQANVEESDPECEADLSLLCTFVEEFGGARKTIPQIAEADGRTFKLLGGEEDWNPRVVSARLRRLAFRPRGIYKLCVDTTTVERVHYYVKITDVHLKKQVQSVEEIPEHTLDLIGEQK
jgi:hypothetical protein